MNRIYLLLLIAFLCSCGSAHVEVEEEVRPETITKQVPVQVEFAKKFTIDTLNGFIQKLTIRRDYGDEVYYLVPKCYEHGLENQNIINTPVDSYGIFSSGFVPMIEELDLLNSLKVIESSAYIYNEKIHKLIDNKEVVAVRENGILNKEVLTLNAPEVIFTIGFGEGQELDDFKELDIFELPLVEWKEEHPLGRAEWIKVFGALFNKEKEAENIFNEVKSKYLQISDQVTEDKKTVLISNLYQGQWYMPGGKSYVAKYLEACGGEYPWSNEETSGSIPLSFESVVSNYNDPSVWIQANANSIDELLSQDSRLQYFMDKVGEEVYHYSKRTNDQGGNDYFESAVLHPERVLKDYQIMISGGNEEDLFYFERLK